MCWLVPSQPVAFVPTNIDINDNDDIFILSTALNGKAELFVTGDKELLELEKIQSMRIISPGKFRETLKTSPD
jgi:predicted nucleic acid-binding protein